MSAGIPLPTCVFSHGFLNAEDGRKMSKSLGNVIDPNDLLDKFPADTFRFALAKIATYGSDFPFGVSTMVGLHNAILKNGYGNLVSRALALCKKYCGGAVPSEAPYKIDGVLPFDVEEVKRVYATSLAIGSGESDGLQIQSACEAVCTAISKTNEFLTKAAPWHMKGDDEDTAATRRAVVRSTMEAVYAIAHFLEPFTPEGVATVVERLGHPLKLYGEIDASLTNLVPGTPTTASGVLYEELNEQGVVKRGDANQGAKKKMTKEDFEKARAAKAAKKAANKKKNAKGKEPTGPLFTQVDVRVGKIVKVWNHPEAERLYCEEIDVGEEVPRQIASGLREHYSLEEMEGRMICVICNLKPAKLAGFKSSGMVLCASTPEKVEFVDPPADAKIGDRVSLPGFFGEDNPVLTANQMKKRKVWEKVAKVLATNDDREVCFDGVAVVTESGAKIVAPSLKGAPVKYSTSLVFFAYIIYYYTFRYIR